MHFFDYNLCKAPDSAGLADTVTRTTNARLAEKGRFIWWVTTAQEDSHTACRQCDCPVSICKQENQTNSKITR